MQRKVEKFTHVHADSKPCYEGAVADRGRFWAWNIYLNDKEVAKGEADTKPEAMRNFRLAFDGFINSCGKSKIIVDPKLYAPENFEKYKEE